MMLRSTLLGKCALGLAVIGIPALTIEANALIRSGSDRKAELRVAERIGATIERPSSGTIVGPSGAPLVVTSIAVGGPARTSGLQVGDVILAADAQPVHSLGELAQALPENAPHRFTVDRHGRRLQMMLPTRGRAFNDAGGASVP
jgi:S1-C subfamily serine protease